MTTAKNWSWHINSVRSFKRPVRALPPHFDLWRKWRIIIDESSVMVVLQLLMFKQKPKQCNHLNCCAVTLEDECNPARHTHLSLFLMLMHRQHASERHNGTLWSLQNNLPCVHLRTNYMFTIEALVPVSRDIFTALRGSSMAKVKLWRSSFIRKFTLLFEGWPIHSLEITPRALFISSSFIAASSASLGLYSPLAIGALIEALLSHVYHRGNVALQIIIVLWISITTEERLCFNSTNTGPSSFVSACLPGLS